MNASLFLIRDRIIAIFLTLVGCYASSKPAPALPATQLLPKILISILAQVKAGTHIPVLLPSELPRPFSDAKHAVVVKATADEYAVDLYYELGVGGAGFAASFGAKNEARYSPRKLPNVREVKLAGDMVGFFRPVSCGGSCAPANLWWKQGAALYQVQLKLASALREKDQQRIATGIANSAILAGPR